MTESFSNPFIRREEILVLEKAILPSSSQKPLGRLHLELLRDFHASRGRPAAEGETRPTVLGPMPSLDLAAMADPASGGGPRPARHGLGLEGRRASQAPLPQRPAAPRPSGHAGASAGRDAHGADDAHQRSALVRARARPVVNRRSAGGGSDRAEAAQSGRHVHAFSDARRLQVYLRRVPPRALLSVGARPHCRWRPTARQRD